MKKVVAVLGMSQYLYNIRATVGALVEYQEVQNCVVFADTDPYIK